MTPCIEIEALIDKRARGLDEAERLVLEQHLTVCDSCRENARFMRSISQAIQTVPSELSAQARNRAISGAFDNVVREQEQVKRTRFIGPTALAVAAAAAIALLVQDAPSHDAVRPQETKVASRAPAAIAPAERTTPSPEKRATPSAEAPEGVWIDTAQPETQTFAHAQVELDADTRVRFDTVHTTLELQHGRAVVDVDVSKGRPFRVLTQHFRVEVLGTRFVVTPDTVEVERGRVQVFDLQGRSLARDLRPGTAFSFSPKATRAASEPRISARTYLARAREALSEGEARKARELILRAEDSEPQRNDRAEAGTLRAECALIERNPEAAIRLYRSVADRFGDLSAGENAAFAAAQIASRSQGTARARPLFERYLARYPKGRFADEARARLRTTK